MKFVRIGPSDSEKYDELIETMPAFVKIHSPNCGHCVNMKEAWDALENSDDIKNYDIAIIEVHEGATNTIKSPSGKIDQGLPTIRAVKLHGKKWKEYEGDRSVKDMVNFIKDNFKLDDKKIMSGGKGTKSMGTKRKSSKSKRKSKGTKSKGTKHMGTKRMGTKSKGTKHKGTKSKRKSFSKSKKGRKY
jgi:hypothetical protein